MSCSYYFVVFKFGSLTIVLHRGEQHTDHGRVDPHIKLALDMLEKVAVIIEGRDDSASFSHQWYHY